MIATEILEPQRTVADQLDQLVLEAYGAINLVLAETGASASAALAAAAWCHEFARSNSSAALVDVAEAEHGRLWVHTRRNQRYPLGREELFAALASAEIVLIDGMSRFTDRIPLAVVHVLSRSASRRPLTLAPVASAGALLRHPLLSHLLISSDRLVVFNRVDRQRSALIAASVLRQTDGSDKD